MKPASFEYHAPESLEEALALLARHGGEGKVLAGGQSLVPMMSFRLARPAHVIDINRVQGLSGIRRENGTLVIGATTRQREIELSAEVASSAPLLVSATKWIGHPPIRSRGTIGGSVAHNDPAAEYPAAMLALDAEAVLTSADGERTVAVNDLLGDWLTTSMQAEELLTALRMPAASDRMRVGITELARRHGDFALAGTVVRLDISPDGSIDDARVVAFGGLPRATRLRDAEEVLRGAQPGEEVFTEAGARAGAHVDPVADIHATAEYRKHLVGVLTVRALRSAAGMEA
jgi:aerobic carbon-monoxide dehydrogenase medium subunit